MLATISGSGREGETERRCRGTRGALKEPLGGLGGSGERHGVGSREKMRGRRLEVGDASYKRVPPIEKKEGEGICGENSSRAGSLDWAGLGSAQCWFSPFFCSNSFSIFYPLFSSGFGLNKALF
jgi:hypothetical protein